MKKIIQTVKRNKTESTFQEKGYCFLKKFLNVLDGTNKENWDNGDNYVTHLSNFCSKSIINTQEQFKSFLISSLFT